MPKPKKKKVRLSVSLTEAQKEAVQDIADRSEVSVSRVIQQAVKEFLEKHHDEPPQIFKRPPPKG
jgi:predicted transcriptional regulator